MKVWPFRKTTEKRAGYADAVVDAMLAAATGSSNADVKAVAAAEFGIGLLGRAFGLAAVTPALPALSAGYLASAVRSLMTRGNAVALIDVQDGQLVLRPASSYDVYGDDSRWTYRLTLAGPSRERERVVDSAGVVHLRIGQSDAAPWAGVSPLTRAGLTADLVAMLEKRMAEEAGARVGYLLPRPRLSDDADTKLRADLKAMKGQVAPVETSGAAFGAGTGNAPFQGDWTPRRFGADYPQGHAEIRRDTAADVLTALGIPRPLWLGGDAGSTRESYRLLLVSTIQPLSALITAELSEKLERPIALDHSKLAAADVTGKARAVGSLVQAGIPLNEAMEVAGLAE